MAIKFEKVSHVYSDGSPFTYTALKEVDLEIAMGKMSAIIGATGSGKSTLVQHLNALLLPSDGKVEVLDRVIDSKETPKHLKSLRKDVGLVFQFPEYQLFEETIIKDVAFGPKNFNATEEEALEKAASALAMVGLDKSYYEKSPLDLSGGQKRRVAIAGVIAMEPKVLILDEPIAGLDPKGRDDILNQIRKLHDDYKITTIMISHSMEDVAKVADRVVVMNHGSIILDGKVSDVFKEVDVLEDIGLGVPQVTYLLRELRKKGFDISDDIYTIKDAKKAILEYLNKN